MPFFSKSYAVYGESRSRKIVDYPAEVLITLLVWLKYHNQEGCMVEGESNVNQWLCYSLGHYYYPDQLPGLSVVPVQTSSALILTTSIITCQFNL